MDYRLPRGPMEAPMCPVGSYEAPCGTHLCLHGALWNSLMGRWVRCGVAVRKVALVYSVNWSTDGPALCDQHVLTDVASIPGLSAAVGLSPQPAYSSSQKHTSATGP